jgi:hypothetical protein
MFYIYSFKFGRKSSIIFCASCIAYSYEEIGTKSMSCKPTAATRIVTTYAIRFILY